MPSFNKVIRNLKFKINTEHLILNTDFDIDE